MPNPYDFIYANRTSPEHANNREDFLNLLKAFEPKLLELEADVKARQSDEAANEQLIREFRQRKQDRAKGLQEYLAQTVPEIAALGAASDTQSIGADVAGRKAEIDVISSVEDWLSNPHADDLSEATQAAYIKLCEGRVINADLELRADEAANSELAAKAGSPVAIFSLRTEQLRRALGEAARLEKQAIDQLADIKKQRAQREASRAANRGGVITSAQVGHSISRY